jgi:hypothetical protein
VARMIPPVVGDETASPGEKELFRRFRLEPGTDGWVVLHSLDVPDHRRQLMGEIDFVIAVPGQGVLCLEVKSNQSVRRDPDGVWHLGQRRPTRTGPFRQASEAMHSLREYVFRRAPELRRILFWSAVCFTRVPFSIRSPAEWHDWQVIDAAALRSRPLATLITAILVQARSFTASKPSAAWFDPGSPQPTPEQIESLIRILRPSFEFFESPKSRRRQREDELLRYTTEQFVALDAMNPELNPRVVFEGAAGTGKTLLALEETRRSVLRQERVLLCCFNRLLGSWLKKEAEPLGDRVTATTFHRYLLSLTSMTVPGNADDRFWQQTLPDLALEKSLNDGEHFEPFDILILDEAQDLLRDSYLNVLDAVLNGGLADGHWRFFGDFEQQAIYGSSCLDIRDVLAKRAPSTPRYLLTRNCRNTPRIASFVQLLGGFGKGYGQVLRPDTGVEPETIYVDSPADQERKLVALLERLFGDGYSGREIVILSPQAKGSAAERIASAPLADRLTPASAETPGGIRYGTVHSFKGLEAPVIIVTDVTSIGTIADQSLFYVAVTRATDRLYVLASASLKPAVLDLLLRRTNSGSAR